MSSSDSDFEVGENSCSGYQQEPEYTEEELAAAAATNEESTKNEEDEAIDKNVCSCGHCALLPKQRECLCCKQFQHYDEHYTPDSLSPRYILKLFDKNIKYSYSYTSNQLRNIIVFFFI